MHLHTPIPGLELAHGLAPLAASDYDRYADWARERVRRTAPAARTEASTPLWFRDGLPASVAAVIDDE